MKLGTTHLMLIAALGLGSVNALAQDDSSADAGATFAGQVNESTGVIVRVPLNERGEEVSGQAEIRLHDGAQPTGDSVTSAFDDGIDASTQSAVSASDVSSDSSTNGWYSHDPYNHHRPLNYCRDYYRTYYPTYYWGGWYTSFSYGYSYNHYYSRPYNNCSGYRYYYYNRWNRWYH